MGRTGHIFYRSASEVRGGDDVGAAGSIGGAACPRESIVPREQDMPGMIACTLWPTRRRGGRTCSIAADPGHRAKEDEDHGAKCAPRGGHGPFSRIEKSALGDDS